MTSHQMAAKFQEARQTVRRHHPEDWKTQLASPMAELRGLMASHGEDVIHAILRIAKLWTACGGTRPMTYWLAAAAEIAEPTP